MSASRQRDDGTWEPADPLPWQPGIDWEVYGKNGEQQTAVAYSGPTELARITGRGLLLRVQVWHTHRRLAREWVAR